MGASNCNGLRKIRAERRASKQRGRSFSEGLAGFIRSVAREIDLLDLMLRRIR